MYINCIYKLFVIHIRRIQRIQRIQRTYHVVAPHITIAFFNSVSRWKVKVIT